MSVLDVRLRLSLKVKPRWSGGGTATIFAAPHRITLKWGRIRALSGVRLGPSEGAGLRGSAEWR